MSHVQAKVFRMLYVSCVVCAGKFLPFKSMLHVLIYNFICAGQPQHRMCRPDSNFVCAGKVFLSNVACADCLENTVICSGQKILCFRPVQRTRTFQDSLKSSKFRRSIDSAPSPALDEGDQDPILRGRTRRGSRTRARTRPRRQRMLQFCLLWAGRAAAPQRRRQRWLRRESQTLNLLPLINGVLWDTEVRLQFAIAGCNRPDRIGLDSNMTYTMLRQWPSRSQTIPDYLRISQINQS